MPIKGAASINNGVLIVMTQLNSKQLSLDGGVASIGPGLTWGEVYNWIGAQKRVVLGARYSTVGVPGVLLGGGMSYYSGTHGWAANHVVNYELVTADSCIINVNASSQSDLFWALKGGSNNYGIVTRFDLETFPASMIYGGSIAYNTSSVPLFMNALIEYLKPGGGVEDGHSALVPALFVSPPGKLVEGYVEVFHDSPDPAPASLVNFTSISAVANTAQVRTYSDLLTETSAAGNDSYRQTTAPPLIIQTNQVLTSSPDNPSTASASGPPSPPSACSKPRSQRLPSCGCTTWPTASSASLFSPSRKLGSRPREPLVGMRSIWTRLRASSSVSTAHVSGPCRPALPP